MQKIIREAVIERRQPQFRWSAVFAGVSLAVGVWILLAALGTGLGLATVDVDDAGSLRGAGVGTGIWSLVAPALAIFAGALVTGKFSGARTRFAAALHGGVVWGITTVAGLWAVLAVVSSMASGAVRIGSAAAGATSAVVSSSVTAGAQVDADDVMSALGIDTNDLLAPINQRLERDGKPPATSRELQATIRGIAQKGLHQGRLDRKVLVDELAQNTALSRTDAEDLATQFGDKYESVAAKVQGQAQRLGEQAKGAALEAVDKTGKVLLFGGLMMLLSLAAALAGAAIGSIYYWNGYDDGRPLVAPVTPAPTQTRSTEPKPNRHSILYTINIRRYMKHSLSSICSPLIVISLTGGLVHAQSDIPDNGALPPARSDNDPRPAVPTPDTTPEDSEDVRFIEQAGVGGRVSYARKGVLELGGSAGFSANSQVTQFTLSPTVGWFIIDNLELSALLNITYVQTEDSFGNSSDATLASVLAEPSYHYPFSRSVFGFAGLGVGFSFQTGPGIGFALAPRVGGNFLIGRSGIFTPALTWEVNAGDQLDAVRVGAGYTVMW